MTAIKKNRRKSARKLAMKKAKFKRVRNRATGLWKSIRRNKQKIRLKAQGN